MLLSQKLIFKENDFALRLLLLNQFHDVIPGSSIEMVVEDALRYYGGTFSKAVHQLY